MILNMKYYHRDNKLIYLVGPILLIIGSTIFQFIALKFSLLTKLVTFILLGLGVISLIIELKKKNRVWTIEKGMLNTPDAKIELALIKNVTRVTASEFLQFEVRLTDDTVVKIDPPFSSDASKELFSLLTSIALKNRGKEDDGE